jgi:O-antigen/teichoic acid export membrane protein
MSKQRRIATAIGWNLGFSLITIIAQLGIAMALARILLPVDYGVFALANAIVSFGSHLTQRGLSTAILRQKELTGNDLGQAYLLAAIVSVFALIVIMASAAFLHFASSGKQYIQAEILAFMVIPLIIQVMTTPAATILQRNLSTGRTSLFALVGLVVGNGMVTLVCGIYGYGPWSLAFGATAAAFIIGILNLHSGWIPLTLNWDSARLKHLLWDAIAFNGLRALDVGWIQLPMTILGLRAQPASVGIFQRMQFFSDLMLQMTVWRVSAVFYAALASDPTLTTNGKQRYRLILMILAGLVLPIAAFVLIAAESIIGSILGDIWLVGADAFRILTLAFGISTLNQAANMTQELRGQYKSRYLSSFTTLIIVGLLMLLIPTDRLTLFAIPALISIGISTILVHRGVDEKISNIPAIARQYRPGFLLACATAFGAWLGLNAAQQFSVQSHVGVLVSQLCISVTCILVTLPFVLRLPELQSLLKMMIETFPTIDRPLRFFAWRPNANAQ